MLLTFVTLAETIKLANQGEQRSTKMKVGNVYVVVNFLSQLIFIFPLFWGMVMYANEF